VWPLNGESKQKTLPKRVTKKNQGKKKTKMRVERTINQHIKMRGSGRGGCWGRHESTLNREKKGPKIILWGKVRTSRKKKEVIKTGLPKSVQNTCAESLKKSEIRERNVENKKSQVNKKRKKK